MTVDRLAGMRGVALIGDRHQNYWNFELEFEGQRNVTVSSVLSSNVFITIGVSRVEMFEFLYS